jgi:cystathionine beta-lyase/cystathionine gamma-synthase
MFGPDAESVARTENSCSSIHALQFETRPSTQSAMYFYVNISIFPVGVGFGDTETSERVNRTQSLGTSIGCIRELFIQRIIPDN